MKRYVIGDSTGDVNTPQLGRGYPIPTQPATLMEEDDYAVVG